MELRVSRLGTDHLHDISLTIAAGETLCVHGPSGSGKSLLLRAIADLDPSQGEVSLGGEPRSHMAAPEWRGRVIYVPPESHWWDERVAAHADDWSREVLQELGFQADVLDWEVARLSTGERQRLAIARTLARRPPVLLLDEPTANLDPDNVRKVERALAAYQAQQRAALLWVSHDPAQRERVADRVCHMQPGGTLA